MGGDPPCPSEPWMLQRYSRGSRRKPMRSAGSRRPPCRIRGQKQHSHSSADDMPRGRPLHLRCRDQDFRAGASGLLPGSKRAGAAVAVSLLLCRERSCCCTADAHWSLPFWLLFSGHQWCVGLAWWAICDSTRHHFCVLCSRIPSCCCSTSLPLATRRYLLDI